MRNRRALSSMVGAVFFIIAMTVAIGYISFSMDTLDQFAQTIIVKAAVKEDQSNEEFKVNKVTIDGNLFNITVTNTGQIPMNITRLWIENVTSGVSAADAVPKSCDIKQGLGPLQTAIKIGQSCSITASDSATYHMKLVTERGKINEFSVNSGGSDPLYMKLHALSSSISSGFTTTILYEIVHNMTNSNVLLNLKPTMSISSAAGVPTWTLMSGPDPPIIESLSKGDTTIIKWIYQIDGISGDRVKFDASLENTAQTVSVDVSIATVLVAETSYTSLISRGLGGGQPSDSVLVFHNETDGTPNGEYQMDNRDADLSGYDLLQQSGTEKIYFLAKNDANTRNISAGEWNIVYSYFSSPVPESLMSDLPDMVYHFEEGSLTVDAYDSIDGSNPMAWGEGGCNTPEVESGSGPNATKSYKFDGSDCISTAIDVDNDVREKPDSTSGWFKLSEGSSGNRYIYNAEKDDGSEYYRIWIDESEQLNYSWKPVGGGFLPTTCTSSAISSDTWYHFVGIRANIHECYLYINGAEVDHSTLGDGGDDVGAQSILMGSFATDGTDGFNGWLDDFMHWDNYLVTASQANDLYKTSYGADIHSLDFNIDKVDQPATTSLLAINKSATSTLLPFLDSKGGAGTYLQKYYTFNTISDVNFNPQERLRVNITSNNIGLLGMGLRIDDDSIFDGKVTYIQFPDIDIPFGSDAKYDRSGTLNFTLRNFGTEGIWVTYGGTRAIFQSITTNEGWAGMLKGHNGTAPTEISEKYDSIHVRSGGTIELEFYQPNVKPQDQNQASGKVPVGSFKLSINIIGYDTSGAYVFKTFNLGYVTVF